MIGNKNIVASIRTDGKVYSVEDGMESINNYTNMLNTIRLKNQGSVSPSSASSVLSGMTIRTAGSVIDLGKNLLQCAKDDDLKGVQAMMRRGAPFSSDWLGMTAIHFAAMNNNVEIGRMLLKAGINKDAKTKVDRTPLHFAAFYGHMDMAALLLEVGLCCVNSKDLLKMTPLHWAVEKRHKNIVKLLLKHNADPTIASKFGYTPIALAVKSEQPDLLEILENARKDLQSKKINEEHEKETNDAVNSITDILTNNVMPTDPGTTSGGDENFDDEDMTALEPIVQMNNLQDHDEAQNSALEILKSHGISMMHDEDPANNILTSALQNGRRLVLSEGGKLLLNNAHIKQETKSPQSSPTKSPLNNSNLPPSIASNKVKEQQVKVASERRPSTDSRFRPNIISKAKENAKNNQKIRIISMNEFKQMYGPNSLKALQKVSGGAHSANSPQVTTITKVNPVSAKKYPVNARPGQRVPVSVTHKRSMSEDSDLPPNIIKVCHSDSEDDSYDEESTSHNQIAPAKQPPPASHPVRVVNSQRKNPVGEIRPFFSSQQQKANTVIPLLSIPEICRQLHDVKKQLDDLRVKYDQSRQEAETYRQKVASLEKIVADKYKVETMEADDDDDIISYSEEM